MALLNYTTDVPASRSIGQVQGLLVDAGARTIVANYNEDGRTVGLAFTMQTPFGPRQFTLPVDAGRVQAVLVRDKVPARYQSPEHAERVAWRILKDWVEAQLAIIRTEMVTLDQVMLPYMRTDNGPTVYEIYASNQLALPSGTP